MTTKMDVLFSKFVIAFFVFFVLSVAGLATYFYVASTIQNVTATILLALVDTVCIAGTVIIAKVISK